MRSPRSRAHAASLETGAGAGGEGPGTAPRSIAARSGAQAHDGTGHHRTNDHGTADVETVVGLEVHVQLATRTKLFCRCPHRFGAPANSLCCPVCLGYPGALPRLGAAAVDLALRLAAALEATVERRSAFDRKSYFYPDLPKGYQITQQRHPLARGGRLPYDHGGSRRRLELTRLHLEEDAGRLAIDDRAQALVDFNRAGAPLVEIVTRPVLGSGEEARSALASLRRLLVHTGVSDASLEEGSLRCDANVSVRPRGADQLGQRVELKNLASLRHVARGIEAESRRQTALLAAGRPVAGETRSYDPHRDRTEVLRGKESGADYRFLPEPDLPPVIVPQERLDRAVASLPEPPWERQDRLAEELGLDPDEARTLVDDPRLADYAEAAAAAARGARAPGTETAPGEDPAREVARWVLVEVLGHLAADDLSPADLPRVLPPQRLAATVALVRRGQASRRAAKEILAAVWGRDEDPEAALERLGLGRVTEHGRLAAWVDESLEAHPREAARLADGEDALVGFFMGRVMERSGGAADPVASRRLIEARRDASESDGPAADVSGTEGQGSRARREDDE